MIIIVFSCWRVLVRGRLFQATSVLCALWHGPSKQRIRRGCKPRHTKDDRSHRHPKHKNQSQNTHTLNSAKAKKQTRTPKGLQLQYVCSVPGTKKLLCFVCSTRSRPPSGSKTHARRACPDSLANSENPVCTAVWGTNERTNRQKRRKQTNTAKHITRQQHRQQSTTRTKENTHQQQPHLQILPSWQFQFFVLQSQCAEPELALCLAKQSTKNKAEAARPSTAPSYL